MRKCAHVDTAEELLRSYFGMIAINDHQAKLCTIEYEMGFEQYGSYESWGTGYVVRFHRLVKQPQSWMGTNMKLDPPLVESNKCLTCAVERIIKKANELAATIT